MMEYCSSLTLCYTALCLLSAVTQLQGSRLLESLECLYDFDTLVTCTWHSNYPYRHLVNMSLMVIDKSIEKIFTCQSTTEVNLTWTCLFVRNDSYFYLGLTEEYWFSADVSLERQVVLDRRDTEFTAHRVPIVYYNEAGYFLWWSEDFHQNATQKMAKCEVRYRKKSEGWEKSLMGDCTNSWAVYKTQPIGDDVAQMRIKYNNGQWSNWSSEILLNPETMVDEAKPQNLRCANFGLQLTCLWELRQEMADIVSFVLVYKGIESGKEAECKPTCQQEVPDIPYISCRCSSMIHDLNITGWYISLKPREEFKSINVCQNVWSKPPRNLTIKETQGQAYEATWNNTPVRHYEQVHEVCYWRDGDPQIDSNILDCQFEKIIKTANEHPEVVLRLGEHLQALSIYHMKVRTRIRKSDCPRGPWSEWSDIQTWKTKAVTDHTALYVLIPLSITVAIICCSCGLKFLQRRKKKWEEMIPNPSKSLVILQFQQKTKSHHHVKCTEHHHYEEHHPYEELADSCRLFNPKSIDLPPIEKILHSTSGQSHHNLIYWNPDILKENKDDSITQTEELVYRPYSELIDEEESRESLDSSDGFEDQPIPTAYDGPYVLCPS